MKQTAITIERVSAESRVRAGMPPLRAFLAVKPSGEEDEKGGQGTSKVAVASDAEVFQDL